MWQCAGDRVSNQTHQQPFCYFLLLLFRDDGGYSSVEIVLHVESHALTPVGYFFVAVDGSSVDDSNTEPMVVMESVTCQVTSCWWQHRGGGRKHLEFVTWGLWRLQKITWSGIHISEPDTLVMVESTQIIVFLRWNSVCNPQWERKTNISKAP